MRETPRNLEKNKPETPEVTNEHPDGVEVFEPKFKHIQEDLRYMFDIKEIEDEEQLQSSEVKNKLYTTAVKYLKQTNPFALHYFIEEGLLSERDIPDADFPMLESYARTILEKMRSTTMRNETERLFIKSGILSETEVKSINTAH